LKNLTRTALPCLLAAGSMILGFSTFSAATAGDVPTASTDNMGPVVAAGFPGLPGLRGKGKGKAKAEAAAPVPPPEPNPDLRAGLQCIDGLVPGDVQVGVMREYDVKEGMNTSQRTGFLDRKPADVSNGCFLGELQPAGCFAFTVDQKKYEALGNSNDWQVQCVYSDDPGAGAIENKDEYPYQVDSMPGKAMMLLCGHTEGDGYECDEGNNSGRSGVWQKKMEAQGKQQLGFCTQVYSKQSLPYIDNTHDDGKYASGRWVYCQYYNKQSKKNLFGYEFLQTSR
jgi:hypothetical protein